MPDWGRRSGPGWRRRCGRSWESRANALRLGEHGGQSFEISTEEWTILRLMQRCRRMHHRNDRPAINLARLAVDAHDPLARKPSRHREPPERDDDVRIERCNLCIKKLGTCIDLFGLWIAIVGRTVLDDVGDEHILTPETGAAQQLGEELSRGSDERSPLAIFVHAWSFANEHDARIGRSFTRYCSGRRTTQCATRTVPNALRNPL